MLTVIIFTRRAFGKPRNVSELLVSYPSYKPGYVNLLVISIRYRDELEKVAGAYVFPPSIMLCGTRSYAIGANVLHSVIFIMPKSELYLIVNTNKCTSIETYTFTYMHRY